MEREKGMDREEWEGGRDKKGRKGREVRQGRGREGRKEERG